MNIIRLPEALLGKTGTEPHDVIIYHHIGHDSHYRSKISFDTHCLVLLLTGKKHLFVEDQNLFYENKSCLLFKSGNYLSTEISPDGKPYHSLIIFFNHNALSEFKHKYHDLLKGQPEKSSSAPFLHFNTDEYVEQFKKCIQPTLSETKEYSPSLQKIKFEEIMLYLLEKHGRMVTDFFDYSIDPANILTFKKIVEANVHNNITIDELAFLCMMSRSTFKRTFQEVYGMNPGQWQKEKLLDYAAWLLRVERKKPSEIYPEAGYSSLSGFIHSFKKKFGQTPKQYQLS